MRRFGAIIPGIGLRPWLLTLGLCLLYLTVIIFHYHNGPLEFVHPILTGNAGYDGQFTFCIALDPLNGVHCMDGDVPAYRYQRILHVLLSDILGLGRATLIPWAMLAINVAMLAVGTAALEQLLIAEGINRWYALTYGLFGGVFIAVRYDTTEPLAYGLVLLAIWAGRRDHLTWQALLLMLAAFAKETTLFFTAGYLIYFVVERRWRDILRLSLIAVLPFVIWQIVLRLWLGQFGIGSGGAMATPFELFPFNGIWRITERGFLYFLLRGLYLLPYAVWPTLWAFWRGGRDIIQRRWHPYVFLLVANAAIMPLVPFSTYREPVGIARFMVGLVISVVLYAALRKDRRVLRNSTIWIFFGLLLIS